LSTHLLHILISKQVLTVLSLRENEIGNLGAKELAVAFETNTVRIIFLLLISYSYFHSTQTLITLDLTETGIGVEGTQYLANALWNNEVSIAIISHSYLSLLTDTQNTEACIQLNW
jgi:hypothetical protein